MTKTSRSPSERPRRALTALLGAVWLGVLASWTVTALAVMGSLGVVRRIAMNSEWAFDTGRLPHPWVIAVGVVAVIATHWLFRWVDDRRRGRPVSPVVAVWCGLLLGVAVGAFLWVPPLMVGAKVGPSSGMKQPWDVLAWAAYYANLWLPGAIGLVTAGVVLFSQSSPVRALGRRRG